jgi:hypothetical protein
MIWRRLLVTHQNVMSLRPRAKGPQDSIDVDGEWLAVGTVGNGRWWRELYVKPLKHGRILDVAIFCTNSLIHLEASEVFYKENHLILGDSPYLLARRQHENSHHFALVHATYCKLVRNVHCVNVKLLWLQRHLCDGARMLSVWPNLRNLGIEIPSAYLRRQFDNFRRDLRSEATRQQIIDAAVYQVRYTLSMQQTRLPKKFEVRLIPAPAWDIAPQHVQDFERLQDMVAEVVSRVQAAKSKLRM